MMPYIVIKESPKQRDSYGCFSFLLDIFMVAVTCGFWLIWIFVRELRKR